MNLAHVGATTGLDDIFPGLGLAFSWKGARMQYASHKRLLFFGVTGFSIQKSLKWSVSCFPKKKVSFVCTEGRNTQKKLSLRKTCGRFPECFLGGGGRENTAR